MSRFWTAGRTGAAVVGLVLMGVLPGCGGGPESYPVRGKVTLDGKPLADALVSFMPEGEHGAPGVARTDQGGNYVLIQSVDLEGIPAGKYKVRITTFKEGNPDANPPTPTVPERVPPTYNTQTTLKREVKPEEEGNVFDFPLRSTGQAIPPTASR